jgi:hypothetical protein
MDKKEINRGELTNEDIERDLKAKGQGENTRGYSGLQDTGDQTIRHLGTDVQRRDGLPEDETEKNASE